MKSYSRTALLRAGFLLGVAMPASVFVAPAAHAQDYTNIVASGRVTSGDGTPLAGATVSIRSSDRGITLTARTNDAGAYNFSQVTPGGYDFVVTADGYVTYEEKGVQLTRSNGGANTFRLVKVDTSAHASNEIVVSGRRVRTADFNDTTTGAVIDIAELDKRVPVGRSLQDVAMLSPGVTRGSSGANSAFDDQITISGASFTENAYFVNGLNITNFRMGLAPVEVPYDFYKTIEVKTGGFPAEFGRATGGVINAVTKSGSNQFHASVSGTWDPAALRSVSPATHDENYQDATASKRELVMQASGPIIKDRLFIYGLYDARDFQSFTPDQKQNNATRVTNTSPFWGTKVDGYITDGQHLEFTYFNSTNTTRTRSLEYDRQTKQEGAQTGGTDEHSGGENLVARYTGTFAPWITVSGAYGINKLRDATLPLDITHERVLDYRTDASGIDLGLNKVTDAYGDAQDTRHFYRADVDFNFQLLGGHHLRIGFDHETDRSLQIHQTMGAGFYKIFTATADSAARLGIPVGTDYYTTRVYANNGDTTVKNEAYYLEDNWSLFHDRVKLELGIRNDRFSNQGVDGKSFFSSGNQWAPRLGASFDVFGDSKTKAYAYFGKYYLPAAGDLNLNVAGGLVTYTRYNLFNGLSGPNNTPVAGAPILAPGLRACPDTKVANCDVAADGTPSDYSSAIAGNLKSQSASEFIIGGEHQFGDRIHIGAYFTHRTLNNAMEDFSIDDGERAYCAGAGFSAAQCAAAYPGGTGWVIGNPGRDTTVKIKLPDGTSKIVTLSAKDLGYPTPKRNYNSLTLTIDRKWDGVWSLGGSYTWALDKGNYEGGIRSENGQLSVNRSADFDSPGFLNGAYGDLPNDRRHTLKLYGSYRPVKFLDLGANLLIQSPEHYSCIGTVPYDVDPVANGYHGYSYYCNGQLVPRGTAFQGDWLYQFDANAVIHLPMPRGLDGSVRIDAFNLFNLKAVTAYNEFGQNSDDSPNPYFHTPVTYQTPRYVRVQFRLGF